MKSNDILICSCKFPIIETSSIGEKYCLRCVKEIEDDEEYAISIKTWCEPLNNFTFQKGFEYKIIESDEDTVTILDWNSTNMSKGGKHTISWDTFKTLFKKREEK